MKMTMDKSRLSRQQMQQWQKCFASADEDAMVSALSEVENCVLMDQQLHKATVCNITETNAAAQKIILLEKVLVPLVRHPVPHVRERAVVLLNVLYDGHDLQLHHALDVDVVYADQKQRHVLVIPFAHWDGACVAAVQQLVKVKLLEPAARPWRDVPIYVSDDRVAGKCILPLLNKPGFYDWILVSSLDAKVAGFVARKSQGRVVVLPARVSTGSGPGSQPNPGSFEKALTALPRVTFQPRTKWPRESGFYEDESVSCVSGHGCRPSWESSLAVLSKFAKKYGGVQGNDFQLLDAAMHEHGAPPGFLGGSRTDWNLVADKLKMLACSYGVRGIRMGQSLCLPFAPRIESEAKAYHATSCSGFWSTHACTDSGYPHPFFIKLLRELWKSFPDYIVAAELSELDPNPMRAEQRAVVLARSGLVVHTTPSLACQASLCLTFGHVI